MDNIPRSISLVLFCDYFDLFCNLPFPASRRMVVVVFNLYLIIFYTSYYWFSLSTYWPIIIIF